MEQNINNISNLELQEEIQGKSFQDYLNIILLNIIPILIVLLVSAIISIYYAFELKDQYRSTAMLKIDNPKGNILTEDLLGGEMSSYQTESFILNQIELMKSYYIRDLVANALSDSIKNYESKKDFTRLIISLEDGTRKAATQNEIRRMLSGLVKFEQPNKKVNILLISCDNSNFEEAKLITTTYSSVFEEYTKIIGRLDVTAVKNYLAAEKDKKYSELIIAESTLQGFQKQTGLISVNTQADLVINNISTYDAAKSNTEIETRAVNSSLGILNEELKKIDPEFTKYIDNQFNTSYVEGLTKKIAELEVNRDIELSTLKDEDSKRRVKKLYNERIEPLKKSYDEKVVFVKDGILSKTPQDKITLTEKILESRLTLTSLNEKNKIISRILSKYENEFNQLPEKTIEYAKLERNQRSLEKLYLILEEKFQEASINERARIGNAFILDPGIENFGAVGPNRLKIILIGLAIGLILGVGFAFGRDFLDRTIKDPEQLEKKGISMLSWIPSMEGLKDGSGEQRILIQDSKNNTAAEAFKALRTRIQYSRTKDESFKSLLLTSSVPGEGKTSVSGNLAMTFALSNKKTLIIDCDFRKPKLHTLFKQERYPGLCDIFFSDFDLKDVIRTTETKNLNYISCGTLPPNPSEILGSEQMYKLLKELEKQYDIVILDSPPFMSVTDSEILFNITDGTILVARAGKTNRDAFFKTYSKLKSINSHKLLGCVLNDFSFKKAYGYYYYNNYYYYYSYSQSGEKVKSSKKVSKS